MKKYISEGRREKIACNARQVLLGICGVLAVHIAQAQTISQLYRNSYAPGPMTGQSFTATLTGEITAIAVADEDGADVNLRMYNGDSGSGVVGEVGTPAYTQPLTLIASETGTLQRIQLTRPFPVVAGSTYSFVFDGSLRLHGWSGRDAYPGGTLLVNQASKVAGNDLAFEVYEQLAMPMPSSLAVIPSSTSWSLLGAGLLIVIAALFNRRRLGNRPR